MGADLGRTILYGIAVSIPVAVVSGIFYGQWIAKRIDVGVPEIASAAPKTGDGSAPPPVWMVILLLLLPVALIFFGAALATLVNVPMRGVAVFLGHPFTALTIAALASLYLFGLRRGVSRERAMKMAADSLAPMGALLCIMGGGGAFNPRRRSEPETSKPRLSRISAMPLMPIPPMPMKCACWEVANIEVETQL